MTGSDALPASLGVASPTVLFPDHPLQAKGLLLRLGLVRRLLSLVGLGWGLWDLFLPWAFSAIFSRLPPLVRRPISGTMFMPIANVPNISLRLHSSVWVCLALLLISPPFGLIAAWS